MLRGTVEAGQVECEFFIAKRVAGNGSETLEQSKLVQTARETCQHDKLVLQRTWLPILLTRRLSGVMLGVVAASRLGECWRGDLLGAVHVPPSLPNISRAKPASIVLARC